MKLMIFIGITVFGVLGGWLGGMLDHGNMFGAWGILFSTVGSFLGVWVGYKVGQNLGL
jgi:ABC-type multidrug transport system permease subunit